MLRWLVVLMAAAMALIPTRCCAIAVVRIPDYALAPKADGGVAVAEVREVSACPTERDRNACVVTLAIVEVIGGSISGKEVCVSCPSRGRDNSWSGTKPRQGERLLIWLGHTPGSEAVCYVGWVRPLDGYDPVDLQAMRRVAELLRIENTAARLGILKRMSLKGEPDRVQRFVIEQITGYMPPAHAAPKLAEIFQDQELWPVTRSTAYMRLVHLLPALRGTEVQNVMCILPLALRDPSPDVRRCAVRDLRHLAASDDPVRGDLVVNGPLVHTLQDMLKTERDPAVLKEVRAVLAHVRGVLVKVRAIPMPGESP